MKLDNKGVAALKLPSDKTDVIFFDSALPGFGYRLRSKGVKFRNLWFVQYGHWGTRGGMLRGNAKALPADQARLAAKNALAKVALGGDPQAAKATRRSADKFTLAAVVGEFLTAKD